MSDNDKLDIRNRIIEVRKMRLGDIAHNPHNWRGHPDSQRQAFLGTLREIGWAGMPLVYHSERTGGLTYVDGHMRKEELPDLEADVAITDLDDTEADLLLATYDPLAAMAETNREALGAILQEVKTSEAAVQKMLAELAQKEGVFFGGNGQEPEQNGSSELSRYDVPDALWPSDNKWGIPLLDDMLQANAVDLPVSLWGASKRVKRMRGTWLFYCDDYRFEALWHNPSSVVNTQCTSAVEPNFSIGPQTPMAVAIWQIYRKRWLARWWQTCGIRVFVDMNVDSETFEEIMLLGVPKGWTAYATRGYGDRLDFTVEEYELACKHAGTDKILFMLYGGGKDCKDLAQSYNWVWISEHMNQKADGEVLGGKERRQ